MGLQKGWKPIPQSLKIVSILLTLWYLMAVMGIGKWPVKGFPLLGMFIFGSAAIIIVLLLYLLAPITFWYGLWNRKNWTAIFILSLIGFFLLNSVTAYIRVPEHFGSSAMFFVDAIINVIFFVVIYRQRSYFDKK
jgi:hypothetical protein